MVDAFEHEVFAAGELSTAFSLSWQDDDVDLE
jgi:hypothetical protein